MSNRTFRVVWKAKPLTVIEKSLASVSSGQDAVVQGQ